MYEYEIIKSILPQGILDHFLITKKEEVRDPKSGDMDIEIHLEEKNELPPGYVKSEYKSNGFHKPKRVQDFPLRGRALYLVIKRRRWLHKETNQEIKSDYSYIAKGVKLTKEVADFLKGTGRDPRRYA